MSVDWPMPDGVRENDEYAKYAEVYDLIYGARDSDEAFYLGDVEKSLEPGREVLEVGTGTGRLASKILRAGYRLTGIDASKEMLARARDNLSVFEGRARVLHMDVRDLRLDSRYRLAIAPFAVVAHLMTNEDRMTAFRRVFEHLEPGGLFVYDDMPGWLSGPTDGMKLELLREGFDKEAGMPVRLMTNTIDIADKPLSLRYDFIDWLRGERVVKRLVIRAVFRNISLEEELGLLREAGFEEIEVLGGFDGRAFDGEDLAKNERLVIRARRPS